MIDAVVKAGSFNGRDAGRLFDHADHALVARGIGAIGTGIDIGDIAANRAEMKVLLEIANGQGESVGVRRARTQQMERHPLGALTAHAGQLLQFVNESSHRLGKFSHFNPRYWLLAASYWPGRLRFKPGLKPNETPRSTGG